MIAIKLNLILKVILCVITDLKFARITIKNFPRSQKWLQAAGYNKGKEMTITHGFFYLHQTNPDGGGLYQTQ